MTIRLLNGAGETVVLRAVAGAEPKWNRLFPLGFTGYRPDFPGGKIVFTRAYLATMLANWEREGRLPKQVNFLHRGDTTDDGLPLEEKVAAGWIENLELRDDGLYGLIRWTDRARAHIERDELRYLSPEFHPNANDRVGGNANGQGPTLCGCALLNDPFITKQERVAAANTNPKAARAAGADKMDKAKLIALLALAETATEADIEKALTDRQAKLADVEAKLADASGKLELANQGKTDGVQLRAALDETAKLLKASNERITALENEKKEAAVDGYLTDRVKAGVLTPAMLPGVRALALSAGLDAVKAIYDNAPVVVALGEKGVRGEGAGDATVDAAKANTEFVALMDKYEKEGVDPSVAFNRITRERPDLAKFAARINH